MESAGATWDEVAKVDEYLGRMETLAPRVAGEELLRDVLPVAPRRVLDLGGGDGRLTALVLGARPSVTDAVLVDRSPPMLERARVRFAADQRVTVRSWDLCDSIGPLGRFDVIVSGLAIHHVEHDRKAALFGEIADQLEPGGLFANLEVVASATPELHAAFRRAIGRAEDDPEDRLAGVEEQLGWMRVAGLTQVDCLWRWRGFALLVGTAPA